MGGTSRRMGRYDVPKINACFGPRTKQDLLNRIEAAEAQLAKINKPEYSGLSEVVHLFKEMIVSLPTCGKGVSNGTSIV